MYIHLINYATGPHFDEIQSALISALSGHCNVTASRTPKDSGINLILGANVLAMQGRRIVFPSNTIIFNLRSNLATTHCGIPLSTWITYCHIRS